MSFGERQPGQAAVRHERVVESTAPHLGNTQRQTRAALYETLRHTPSLHHLGHYTGADWDFAVDVVPDPEHLLPAVVRRHRTVGCNLVAKLTLLNNQLVDPGTGALIRTVLHAEEGAIYSNTVMQGERILGVARGLWPPSPLNETVVAADRAVSGLVDRLRANFGQPTQNPGGFMFVDRHPEIGGWPDEGVEHPTLKDRCGAALAPEDLQFLALVRYGATVFAEDVFDHPDAEPFFRAGHTVSFRRDFYRTFAPELEFHVRDLGRIVHPVIGRRLGRVVLDVQRGAIYYYRLDAESYLVGVTLNQTMVAVADLKMEWLSRYPAEP